MEIIKVNGDIEKFKKSKIEKTILKAGGSKKLSKNIANEVSKKISNYTSTKKILELVLKALKDSPGTAKKYNLKQAIMLLGPAGFTFEKYCSRILEYYGYETNLNIILKGRATTHEVDIIAEKRKRFMIECKYHNKNPIHTNSKVAMYTYARFLDLKNNPKNYIDQGWLITNTKCTPHAIEYAKGVGLKITSWNYASSGKNLQELISSKNIYPITILDSVKGRIKEKLVNAKIVSVKDFIDLGLEEIKVKTELSDKEINLLKKEIEEFEIKKV